MVGGARGGSGQYVYALGRQAIPPPERANWKPARSVNYHALAIADTYLVLRRLERAGHLSIIGLSTEPDCWSTIGGVELHPDMYVEVMRGDSMLKVWLEVDMGTEWQRQIKVKLEAFWRAYNAFDGEVFPAVWWVAVDEERATELTWLISQGSPEASALFRVCTRETLALLLS